MGGKRSNSRGTNGVTSMPISNDANGFHHNNSTMTAPTTASSGKGRFTIRLSARFLLITFVLSTFVTFSVGWIARLVLLTNLGIFPSSQYFYENQHETSSELAVIGTKSKKKRELSQYQLTAVEGEKGMSGKQLAQQLPAPKIIAGKEVPYTTYTSKTFHTSAATTANTLHIDRSVPLIEMMGKTRKLEGDEDQDGNGYVPCSAASSDGSKKCSRGKAPEKIAEEVIESDNLKLPDKNDNLENNTIINDYSHNSDEDGLHLPAGQHLLVDIKDVDSNFLNSEERLARAMIELINESKLTLLSYHCHSLVPIGVSCVGVLLESHISFHTWPMEGVITLDLFTCGGNPLVPVLPSIERLFGVAREATNDVYDREGEYGGESLKEEPVKPSMLWAHKLRGFREGFAPNYSRDNNPLDLDLGRYILGKLDFDIKRPLLSTETEFQRVDVYELMYSHVKDVTSYYKSLEDEVGSSYESSHPELFAPDRALLLDGVIQSTLYGDAAYHESIVHPAMMTHLNPKRVAIIGGGEGATLREALKHNTVDKVVMIEIDEEVVTLSKEYLSEWSDCSDIVGSSAWCFDDDRTEARYEDAIQYFKSRFAESEKIKEDEKFDVVIMDAMDPDIEHDFALDLYKSDVYIQSLYNSLTESGVLVVQIGETPFAGSPPDEIGRFKNRSHMMNVLEAVGYKSVHIYEESHSGFFWPWTTLVAFKDYSTRANWYRSSAEIDLDLSRRILPTKSGARPLRNYDGATHTTYQQPSKSFESVECRSSIGEGKCNQYRGFSADLINIPVTGVEVKKSVSGNSKKVGLFARDDIPKNAAIALGQQVTRFLTLPSTWGVIKSHEVTNSEITALVKYIEGFGFCGTYLGKPHCCAESSITAFMGHGGSDFVNYGIESSSRTTPFYCPVIARHVNQVISSGKATMKNVRAGEELLGSKGN